ncbi:MAG: hypothetical protein Q8R24_00470 [Legionellaceae bacterium]|nr:hypothetical protein [Legionellaceae bacterium]
MLSNRDGLVETNQEVEVRSSYSQINALIPRESAQQQDDIVLRSLKAVGLLPASAKWHDDSQSTRTKQQLAYRENAHRIPEGQDGFITTFLKQRGSLDCRSEYEGWGTWSSSEISMFSATQQTEDNGRTVTTFLAADDSDGEMKVRQGLQIINETAVKQLRGDNESRVEILEDEEEEVSSALTNK